MVSPESPGIKVLYRFRGPGRAQGSQRLSTAAATSTGTPPRSLPATRPKRTPSPASRAIQSGVIAAALQMGPPSRRRGALRHDEMHPKLRRSDAGRPSPAALARPCRARAPAPPAGGDPFPGTAGRRRLVAAPGRETGERSPLAGECPRHGVRRPAAALASAHPHASTGASVAGTSQSGGRAAALHMNASVVGSCKGPPSSPRPSARLQTLPHRPAPATIDGGRDAPICRTLGASPAREENHGLWGVYSRARALAFA